MSVIRAVSSGALHVSKMLPAVLADQGFALRSRSLRRQSLTRRRGSPACHQLASPPAPPTKLSFDVLVALVGDAAAASAEARRAFDEAAARHDPLTARRTGLGRPAVARPAVADPVEPRCDARTVRRRACARSGSRRGRTRRCSGSACALGRRSRIEAGTATNMSFRALCKKKQKMR